MSQLQLVMSPTSTGYVSKFNRLCLNFNQLYANFNWLCLNFNQFYANFNRLCLKLQAVQVWTKWLVLHGLIAVLLQAAGNLISKPMPSGVKLS
jgi:hypothetical protein